MRVVVTRPQEDGERTAAVLRSSGHAVLVAPLLKIETMNADLRKSWGGVVITSANAANAIAAHPARDMLIKLPLFAVGPRSAEAARHIGFSTVTTANGDVRDLLQMLAARRADIPVPLLYLAGEDRTIDLAAELDRRGVAVETADIYRAVVVPFPPQLAEALKRGEVDAVLHYSRRSAESYLTGAAQAGVTAQALNVRHFCLSPQVAAPLTAAGVPKIVVAPRPDGTALMVSLQP